MGRPKIRFEGYSEDWEQRKLGDITVKIGSGKTPSGGKSAYVETGIPLIRSQNVNGDKVDFADIVFVDETTDESMANSRVYTNDVLLNITGASIGRSAVYKGLESANVNQHVCIIRPTEGYQPDFIQLNLSSDNGQKQIDASQAGGGREGLNFQEIGKMQFCFPSLNEQKCIGRYFNSLDHFITLHQRKYDETKTLKKYMLQKMFPQNGEKVPEIRFDGFTEDWEQRKLIDYLEVSSEKNRDNRFTKEDVLSVSGEYGIVNQIEFQGRSFAGASVSNYGVVENGDVVYTKSPLKSNPYGIIKTNEGIPGIVSTLYAVYKPKEITDSKFVQIYFELDSRMNSYMHPLVNKGAKNDMKVSAENALKGMVSFPKKDEQEMISLYFSTLDNLITLHQRKCNELKEIKKYMLQNMFV